MRQIWLDNGEPGVEENGSAYYLEESTGRLLFAGTLAVAPEGTGIPLRYRHTTGFPVDKAAAGRPA